MEGVVYTGLSDIAVELTEVKARLTALVSLKTEIDELNEQVSQIENDFEYLKGKVDAVFADNNQE